MALRGSHSQRGFTLIEVLVAITILLVGVLGVVSMVDGANAVTSRNKAREGATNVSRSIVEVARSVRYRDLTATQLLEALEARPGLADARASSGHTIESRGFFYDVTLEVCSMDDPRDGLGLRDAGVAFCTNSDQATSAATATDRNPDDYKRVAVSLTWQRERGTETSKQTSLVSNPIGGLGPSVASITATGHTGSPVTVTAAGTTNIVFKAVTSSNAAEVNWLISGDMQGKADPIGGSQRDFTFTWDINGASGGQYWWDCTYVIGAEAFDSQGRSGKPGALTVVLNRREAFAPDFLQGGRNGQPNEVDLRWQPRPECDVLGYRVYRRVAADGAWEPVTCLDQTGAYTEQTDCIDQAAPEGVQLYYRVMAVDTAPGSGELRDGDPAQIGPLENESAPPTAPANVSACLGGTDGCTGPDGEPAGSGETVLRWDASTDPDGDAIQFYRVYRDGSTYAQRYSLFFPTPDAALAWVDPGTPDGQSHTYRLTAVDEFFRESALSTAVTFP
jgi:prepilin-type N-terminal cleavage/methylation domain-containing protein